VNNWELITTEPWVLDTIRFGLRLPWAQGPPPTNITKKRRQVPLEDREFLLMSQKISEWEHDFVITRVPQILMDEIFVSTIFPVPKGPDDVRPVINLRDLNEYLVYEHFKMESLQSAVDLLQTNDYMTKVDIKSAFQHIPIHKDDQKYLVFVWEGKTFMYRTAPFGASICPRVFTKIMKPVMARLRSQGIKLVIYIDDILVIASSKEACEQHTKMLTTLLEQLGFLVSWEKSIVTPTQSVEFLGMILDSRTMQVCMPPKKVNDLKTRVAYLSRTRTVTVRDLAQVLGKMSSVAPAISCSFSAASAKISTPPTSSLLSRLLLLLLLDVLTHFRVVVFCVGLLLFHSRLGHRLVARQTATVITSFSLGEFS